MNLQLKRIKGDIEFPIDLIQGEIVDIRLSWEPKNVTLATLIVTGVGLQAGYNGKQFASLKLPKEMLVWKNQRDFVDFKIYA